MQRSNESIPIVPPYNKINRVELYPVQIQKFEEHDGKFYEEGKKTFLTRTIFGDCETLYTHTLRYYLPIIV